jgi:hypothetical protein
VEIVYPVCVVEYKLCHYLAWRFVVDAIKKNPETLIDISKESGLEVNTEKTKYMLMSCNQNAGQNHNIKTVNRSLKMWISSNIWEQQ